MIEEELFKKYKADFVKLIEYGFNKNGENYKYQKDIINDKFRVEITVNEKGEIKGKVIEKKIEEEYSNYRCKDLTGEFSNHIKEEFTNVLLDIRNFCYIKNSFKYDQSNRITNIIKDKHQDNPEFLWKNDDNTGVFRNKNNHKWYGIIMNINKNKLDKNSNKDIEIINVKIDPSKLKELLTKKGIYEAYHMNKKNWVSIVLDDTLCDEEIMSLIDISYNFTIN